MKAFVQKGIRAVKMDDIAQSLAISKRTLYEIYENKEILLYEGVKMFREQRQAALRKVIDESPSVMDVILLLYQQKVEEFRIVNPLFYADIERYPSVIGFLDKEKMASHQMVVAFMLRGVKEGFFRSDLDYELMTWFFNAISQSIMASQLYHKYSLEHIMYNLVVVPLRGICTQKGIEILDEFMKNHRN